MLPGCTATAAARVKVLTRLPCYVFFFFFDDCTVVHACKTTALPLEREAEHASGLHHHRGLTARWRRPPGDKVGGGGRGTGTGGGGGGGGGIARKF